MSCVVVPFETRFLMPLPPCLLSRCTELWLFCGQTLVDGADKRIRGPWTRSRTILRLIRFRRRRFFDLIERLSLLDHIRDHVAHGHHHVAVIHNFHLLAEPPVTWYHVSPDPLVDKGCRRDCQFNQLVQGVDLSLYAA